jgi:ankyrin repeat protein
LHWTPLHYAARNAHGAIVEILLQAPGLELSPPDKSGKTPLYYAMNQKIRATMQDRGAK